MRNIFLIARREYLERVRTKSFLIMTILIPLMMAGFLLGPSLLMNPMSHGAKHLVIVASHPQTAETIRQELTKAQGEQNKQIADSKKNTLKRTAETPSELTVDVDTNTSADERAALSQKVRNKQLDGVIWATDEALAAEKIPFITRDTSSFIQNATIGLGVDRALHREALKAKGLSDQEIDSVLKRLDVDPQDPAGTGSGNPQITFVVSFIMVMILYMSVLLYGINVMRAILDEKTSRIMEVMLSVSRPNEMMAGKILGVGAVGLTQIAIWIGTAVVMMGGNLVASGEQLKGVITWQMLLAFAVYYLLGFALYSTVYAAIGAMVNSEQEAQQLQFLAVLPLAASLGIMFNVIQFPNSTIAVWASIFPFTSPLIMFSRIAVQIPSLWQIGLSLAVMIATIVGMVLLCGRIYRVGILMYGKKPTLPEIIKWLRYA
ncbi:MAG TPA: ABC transporter permease [Candidatus Angelobacter sp.]|nr:ABC transporter permease [Candidatus Angelobacter sp.]